MTNGEDLSCTVNLLPLGPKYINDSCKTNGETKTKRALFNGIINRIM